MIGGRDLAISVYTTGAHDGCKFYSLGEAEETAAEDE
jgi:hypothetical protein